MRPKAAHAGVLALCLLWAVPTVGASPWPIGEDQRLSIATVIRETGETGSAWRYGLYSEAGLSALWTVVADYQIQIPDRSDRPERAFGQIGLRRSLASDGALRWAVQASYLDGQDIQIQACEGPGGEVKVSAGGSGLGAFARPAFAVANLSAEAREGACERVKLDVAYGLDLSPRWTVIGEAWVLRGTDAESDKLQISFVRRVGSRWRAQLAARAEVSGRFEETGLLIGFWAPW